MRAFGFVLIVLAVLCWLVAFSVALMFATAIASGGFALFALGCVMVGLGVVEDAIDRNGRLVSDTLKTGFEALWKQINAASTNAPLQPERPDPAPPPRAHHTQPQAAAVVRPLPLEIGKCPACGSGRLQFSPRCEQCGSNRPVIFT